MFTYTGGMYTHEKERQLLPGLGTPVGPDVLERDPTFTVDHEVSAEARNGRGPGSGESKISAHPSEAGAQDRRVVTAVVRKYR